MTTDGSGGADGGSGTRSVADARREQYHALLQLTPHWGSKIAVRQDDDGDWVIVATLDADLCDGAEHRREHGLGGNLCWDTEDEAQEYLDEHEDELRLELCEDLFTMGTCTECDDVVPVLGDYVPFAPNGVLLCGVCRGGEDGTPGIVR